MTNVTLTLNMYINFLKEDVLAKWSFQIGEFGMSYENKTLATHTEC